MEQDLTATRTAGGAARRVGLVAAIVGGSALGAGLLGAGALAATNLYVLAAARPLTFTDLDDLPHRPVGVLPGVSRWAGVRQNPHFTLRISAAHAVIAAGRVDRLVLAGGAPEVAEMREALEELGVAGSALIDDPAGLNTRATVANARGMGPITLIGEVFHMPRALLLARQEGVDAIAYAVRLDISHLEVLRQCVKYRRIPAREREWLARAKDVVSPLA